jgi:nucleoid-associated protein YgaU
MSQSMDSLNSLIGFSGEGGGAVSNVMDTIDSGIAAYVPAMLLIFPSPTVPVPIPFPIFFNPEKLSFSKGAKWTGDVTTERSAPVPTFDGGEPEKLTLKLFLHSSFLPMGIPAYMFIIKQLIKKPKILLDQPPLVRFAWGFTQSAISYIESLDYEYTLFTPGGVPIQGELTLRLVEYDMAWWANLPINPTSRSEARKTWVVTEGETLDWIAFQEYGDAVHWRHIANVNHLANPMKLRSGQILKLTPLA